MTTLPHHKRASRRAIYLPLILIFVAAFISISMAAVEIAVLQRKVVRFNQSKISALGTAEAGISYYLWHLAHNSNDYTDGHPVPGQAPYGPYVHTYQDNNGNVIGTYSLLITPPPTGSTVATIESTGTLNSTGKSRTVKALLGIPSFSQYALITSSEIWFGATESSNGPVFSNVGIHFDGTNNGTVSAANATYTPSANFGGNGSVQNGVWGTGGPQTQWLFPVPAVNFQSISANLQQMKTSAQANGKYLPKSASQGYFIQFQANGTYKLATVTNYSFSNFTTTALVTQPIPQNGVIYADDHVWVEGTVHGRYTVAAATLPSVPLTDRNVTITNNILYTTKNGSDALGLVAQKDVLVAPTSPNIFEIDAAMLSQNGRVYRPCRWQDTNPCFQNSGGTPYADTYNIRNTITVYGSIGCFNYWNWAWLIGNNTTVRSGYINSVQTFDTNMVFAPPPSFPTTGKYALLSWRELTAP